MPKITHQQQYMLEQVAATMAIEDMPLTEQCQKDLQDILTGQKTKEQIITEIKNDAERRKNHV